LSSISKFALIRDFKATSSNGGTFTSGAWRQRDLNTLDDYDSIGISLSANQFTLPSGTYIIAINAPAFTVNAHQVRLLNVTTSGIIAYGTSENAPSNVSSISQLITKFTINSSNTYRVEHRCQSTRTTNGFGIANGFGGGEIYTMVEITRL
jgi:hypothetical protein